MESRGFSVGIWMLWNSSKVTINVIDTTIQAISVKVTWNGCQPWMLSGIYASPCNTVRGTVWSYLDNLSRMVNLPWLLVRDFNEEWFGRHGIPRCRLHLEK